MDELLRLLGQSGFAHMSWGNWIMYAISATLVFLAIKKDYEPLLLIPIAFAMASKQSFCRRLSSLAWVF
jgi:Na+-transporting methylmalonyl-CoA/oxaloacetate decarboxylase beta subunit